MITGAFRRLNRSFARLYRQLGRRADSEHELIRPRLAIGVAVITAFAGSTLYAGLPLGHVRAPFGVYLLHLTIALGIFAHLLRHPAPSPTRRAIGSASDILTTSLFTYVAGTGAAVAFPIYIWVTLGAGLRFGRRDLFITAGISAVAFNVCAYLGDTWSTKPALALALTAGLLIVPIYLASHIKKLADAKLRAEAENLAANKLLLRMRQEVNASLDALTGLGDGLGAHMVPSEQARHARALLEAGHALMAMVGSTLEPTADAAASEAEAPVDLHALLESVRGLLGLRGRAQSVAVAIHVDPALPRRARLSKIVVEQALLTLGTHIVGTSRGGDVIVEAALIEDHGRQCLRFSFTEPKAAPGSRHNIFADRPGRRRATGPATARRLAQAQGGSVGVDIEGESASTWIEVPATPEPATGAATGQRKILLVSADPLLLDALRETGSNVTACTQIDEAIRLIGTGWSRSAPPLLLADARLTGTDLAKVAHAGRYGADVTCLLLRPGNAPPLTAAERMLCFAALSLPLDPAALAPFLPEIPGSATGAGLHAMGHVADPARPLVVQIAIRDRIVQRLVAHLLTAAGHVCRTMDGKPADISATLGTGGYDVAVVEEALLVGATGPLPRVVALVEAASSLEVAVAGRLTRPIDPTLLVGLVSTAAFGAPQAASQSASHRPVATEPADDAEEAVAPKAVPIDFRALADLEKLGGREFVDDIVSQFLGDGQQIIGELEAAATARDEEAFRDLAHALRSCAANVGAQALYKLCLSWRVIERAEIETEGTAHMQAVRTEWESARVMLETWLARAGEAGAGDMGDIAEAA